MARLPDSLRLRPACRPQFALVRLRHCVLTSRPQLMPSSSRSYQRFVFMNRKADELPKGRVKIGGDGRNLHRGVESMAREDDEEGRGSAEPEDAAADDDAEAQDAQQGAAVEDEHP